MALLILGLCWLAVSSRRHHAPVAAPAAATPAPQPSAAPPRPAPKPAPVPPARPALAPAGPKLAAPPAIPLHKELIPKDIEIVRCYYSQTVVAPGTTFGFDINGSGFTEEFQKMIRVDLEDAHLRARNLRLVTANQIHGDMEVGPDAPTALAYPRILIKGLPVFTAPDPFGVVRKGDVLTIIFTAESESGSAGRFQVITNLDEELFRQFRIEPSTPGLRIVAITPHLPFAVEGTLLMTQALATGGYGLAVKIGPREAFRRDDLIRIVQPNVGPSGFVEGIHAEEPYHRPGDDIAVSLEGVSLSPRDAELIQARVDGFDMGPGSITYVSGNRLRVSFHCPRTAPEGSYGVTARRVDGGMLYQRPDVFRIVPPDWVAGARASAALRPGASGVLRILGRDFSADFEKQLTIAVDEPGIRISGLRRLDDRSLAADLSISPTVAAGDYWLHLSARGRKVAPPYGSIIKVEKAP